jgi:protein O-mannosyl-transferase
MNEPVLIRPARRDGKRRGAGALAAVALPFVFAVCLYLPSSTNPLVWDDELHVPIATEMGVSEAFSEAAGAYRRPLVLLSYAVQARLGRRVARDLHVANAIVHGVNAALVAAIVLTLGGAAASAFAAAILFAFHPLASGSVAYISGRTDLFATFFTLAAARLALGRGAGAGVAAGCCAAVLAAALSKESGLVAGPVVSSILWWRKRGRGEDVPALLVALPSVVSLAAAALVFPSAAASAVPVELRLRAAGTALLVYAKLVAWPSGLHLDRLTPTGGSVALAAGAVFVAAASALAVAFVRSPALPALAGMCLLLVYAPGSGLVPAYPAIAERLVFTGEQFLYAPLAVIAMAVAALLARLTGTKPLVPIAAATLAMLVWTLPVVLRQKEFSSAERAYRATLAHSPSPRACVNLGNLQYARRAVEAAATTYQACVDLAPEDAGAHGQLAVALQKMGFVEDARRKYERSIELDDSIALVWSNFATLDANTGRYADARVKWNRALALDPREATARAALSRLDAAGR